MLSFFMGRDTQRSNIKRQNTHAANMLVRIPMLSVVAKPLIGPVPNCQSATAEMSVVRFESRIVTNARS